VLIREKDDAFVYFSREQLQELKQQAQQQLQQLRASDARQPQWLREVLDQPGGPWVSWLPARLAA
jgi:hypothetical protein